MQIVVDVPDSVIVEDKNGSHIVSNDEYIFTLTVGELINAVCSDGEFYKNPTKENMTKLMYKYVVRQMTVLKQDADWYIKNAMPLFLEKELK